MHFEMVPFIIEMQTRQLEGGRKACCCAHSAALAIHSRWCSVQKPPCIIFLHEQGDPRLGLTILLCLRCAVIVKLRLCRAPSRRRLFDHWCWQILTRLAWNLQSQLPQWCFFTAAQPIVLPLLKYWDLVSTFYQCLDTSAVMYYLRHYVICKFTGNALTTLHQASLRRSAGNVTEPQWCWYRHVSTVAGVGVILQPSMPPQAGRLVWRG